MSLCKLRPTLTLSTVQNCYVTLSNTVLFTEPLIDSVIVFLQWYHYVETQLLSKKPVTLKVAF